MDATLNQELRNSLALAEEVLNEALNILKLTEESRFQPESELPCCAMEARAALTDQLRQVGEIHRGILAALGSHSDA